MIIYKLLEFDTNIWNHIIVCNLLVLDMSAWNY